MVSPVQSGTSRLSGQPWRKVDVVLEYEHHERWPKAIMFSVMGDNIEKFGLATGGRYEVEVDFSVREFNGRYFLGANVWKVTALGAAVPNEGAAPASAPEPAPGGSGDDLPF